MITLQAIVEVREKGSLHATSLVGMTHKESRGFWKRVAKGEPEECWPWLGLVKPKGYGRFCWRGHNVAAHRVAWALENRMCPGALHIDHKECQLRDCCNPGHTEAVLPRVNRARREASR